MGGRMVVGRGAKTWARLRVQRKDLSRSWRALGKGWEGRGGGRGMVPGAGRRAA